MAGANLAGAGVVYGGSLSMNVTEMFGLTVASLGRFVEAEGDDVSEWRDDLPGTRYLKFVARAGVPVGAISLGAPEGASLLGRLRPFVRHKRRLADPQAFVEGRDLTQMLARGDAAHRSGTHPAGMKEEAACASSR